MVMHLMEKDSQFKGKEEEDCNMDEDKKDLPIANKGDNGRSYLRVETTIQKML